MKTKRIFAAGLILCSAVLFLGNTDSAKPQELGHCTTPEENVYTFSETEQEAPTQPDYIALSESIVQALAKQAVESDGFLPNTPRETKGALASVIIGLIFTGIATLRARRKRTRA